VFHISIWGGLKLCLGAKPTIDPRGDGMYWYWKHLAYIKLYWKNLILKKATIWY